MLFEGAFPRISRHRVTEWVRRHQEELALNWQRAEQRQLLHRIGDDSEQPVDTTSIVDDIEIAGIWRPQRVVAAEVDERVPFVVTLTFADGYRASVDLRDDSADNLGIVLNDSKAVRALCLDSELGTIVWPNGFDYDPDSLRKLAIEQHPDDPVAVPAPPD